MAAPAQGSRTTTAAVAPRPRSMCDGREWKTVGFSFRISVGSSGGDAHAGMVNGVKLTNNKRQQTNDNNNTVGGGRFFK